MFLVDEDAGRRLAAIRQFALLLLLHVDDVRQEAAVHGMRVRAGGRVELHQEPRLAPAAVYLPERPADADPRPEHPLPVQSLAIRDRLLPRGVSVDRLSR